MVNVEQLLKNLDINTSGRSVAVATTREFIEHKGEDQAANTANAFFYDVFGFRTEFTDRVLARLTAQYVVDAVSQTHYDIGNAPMVIAEAQARAERYMQDSNNAWQFATGETQSSFTTDSDVPKAPKKNKGTASWDLYVIHVKNAATPLSNGQFVDLLVKELEMTKSGARTYAYNCFKRGKEENGSAA